MYIVNYTIYYFMFESAVVYDIQIASYIEELG